YMISELEELGELETTVFYNEVPEITDLSSDECFLHWRFFLSTSHDEKAIKEVFEWVEDDADIKVELCGGLFGNDEPIQPNQDEIPKAV
ncbi:hypothetical protein, partial [Psychrobacter sp. CAL606-MNA-CIBAN-0158]